MAKDLSKHDPTDAKARIGAFSGKRRIQLLRPSYNEEEIEACAEVLRSGWLGFGPKVEEFEKAFATYIGVHDVVGVANGTWALRLALRVLGIQGKKVITTPLTFIATVQAIIAEGGIPLFADVEYSTGVLDPSEVEHLLDSEVAAVVTVHLGGNPGRLGHLAALCEAAKVFLVEDCAHAAGARHCGQSVGTLGKINAFSFQAVKPLAMGEGGAVITNDRLLAERVRRLRWFGIDKDTYVRSHANPAKRPRWQYEIEELGEKAYLDNLHAAIGLVQLRKLDQLNARRAAIATQYIDGLRGVGDLTVLLPGETNQSSWHLFMVQSDHRDALSNYLAQRGIETGVHYNLVTSYAALKGYRASTPRAETLSRRLLSLPMHPELSNADVAYVVNSIHAFFRGDGR